MKSKKQVVIDERVAFIGELDSAYARYDDKHFDLRADAGVRPQHEARQKAFTYRYNLSIKELVL